MLGSLLLICALASRGCGHPDDSRAWSAEVPPGALMEVSEFVVQPLAQLALATLLMIAVFGGMFVVPLYAFLTTKVDPGQAARTVAANNIVNSWMMVAATLILTLAVQLGVTVADSLLIVAVASVVAAWIGWKLHQACD